MPGGENMVIRPITMEDYRYILNYAEGWWGNTGQLRFFLKKDYLYGSRRINLVAEEGEKIIGFLFGQVSQDEDGEKEGIIFLVCVHPAYRKQHIATYLYEQFALEVRQRGGRKLKAVTYKGNTSSLSFHKKLGFELQFENNTKVVPGYERVKMVRAN